MSTKEALEKYDWVRDHWWLAVAVDSDKYDAQARLGFDNGCSLRKAYLHPDILGLPRELEDEIKGVAEMATREAL